MWLQCIALQDFPSIQKILNHSPCMVNRNILCHLFHYVTYALCHFGSRQSINWNSVYKSQCTSRAIRVISAKEVFKSMYVYSFYKQRATSRRACAGVCIVFNYFKLSLVYIIFYNDQYIIRFIRTLTFGKVLSDESFPTL